MLYWKCAKGLALAFLVISVIFSIQSFTIPRPAATRSGYYHQASAANIVGHGLRSLGVHATPLSSATAPSAVQNLTKVAGNGQVTLTWQPPASTGGAPIFYYFIDTYPKTYNNGSYNTVYGTNLTYTDATLTNNVTYQFNVTAVNTAYFIGPPATILAKPTGTATTPAAPQSPYAYGSNGQVQLNWRTPTHFGGAPLTLYTIYRGTSSGAESQLAQVNSTFSSYHDYTDSSVTNGVTYYYEFSAMNKAGQGARSNEVNATPTTPPTAPSYPINPHATPGNGQITLQWEAPLSDGGAPIQYYRIYRGTMAGGERPFNGSISYTKTFTDTGLTNGQEYYYRVTAVNYVGESPLSSECLVTPFAPHAPSAPANLTATAGNGMVTLKWDPPYDTSGLSIINYIILRGTTPGVYVVRGLITSGTTFTDTALVNGQAYYYSVGATSSLGLGTLANISAIPIAPTVPVTLPSTTPTGVRLMTNATISNFSYNQAARSFTFTVTGGATGSIGVANITLPKSLVGSNTNINIYIDGKSISHAQVFFDANNYYLYFTFHLSTHIVNVALGALATSPTGTTPTFDWILIGTLITGIAVGAAGATLFSRRRKHGLSIPSATNP